ncbi:DUF3093 family protein [Hymenobacter oligotrophus]|uniref:DUF3093 family protein n=2 Tax=Hymenobacter oligotrophus TaxID=2319843 RepID=A0A3B7QY62_9BACT|nr:DUF3093 family protein [Hymenobacter oligotrophus]
MQAANQVYQVTFHNSTLWWVATIGGAVLGMVVANAAGIEVSGWAQTALFAAVVAAAVFLGFRLARSKGRIELTPTEIRLTRDSQPAKVIQRADVESCAARISDDGYAKLLLRLRNGQRAKIVLAHSSGNTTFDELAEALGADMSRV